MPEIKISSTDELPAAAAEFAAKIPGATCITFSGAMGSGKTTFIKALCRHWKVTDNISSPTFSIVNEYRSERGKIFHFDFYRIKIEQEAVNLGFDEYLDHGLCLIEWPEKIPSLLPGDALAVSISVQGDSRVVSW